MAKKHLLIILLLLIGVISIYTCDFRADLEKQPKSVLKFVNLPDTVKSIYIKSTEIYDSYNPNDTISELPEEFPELTNLDKNVESSYTYFPSKICRAWYGEQVFNFNNMEIVLSWNGNEINEPYILFNKQLYFVITRNCNNKESYENAEFGKYDLTKLIKVK